LPQIFGHEWTDEKRASFSHLKFPVQAPKTEHLVVSSAEYARFEVGFDAMDASWQQVETNDDLHWHRPEFTDSAFASPEAYQTILKFLQS
jgi:hypothetical protein